MRDYRPVSLENEIGTVFTIVANNAACRRRRCLIVAGARRLDMFGPGTMTGFALNVGELRRSLDIDEAAALERH